MGRKVDVKYLVNEDSEFRLNKLRLKSDLEREITEAGEGEPKPFVLFLDTKDAPSSRYVKYKLEDTDGTVLEAIPIDFTPIYASLEEGSFSIARQVGIIMDKYNLKFLPYIVQIPSTKSRFVKFDEVRVNEIISEIIYKEIKKRNEDPRLPNIASNLSIISDVDALARVNSWKAVMDEFNFISEYALKDHSSLEQSIAGSIIPATPKGILLLILDYLKKNKIDHLRVSNNFAGAKIAVIGCNSKTTGLYLSKILPMLKATVSLYHSKSVISKDEFSNYDVVISCVGIPEFIKYDHIGGSANKLLVDVGVSVVNGKVIGDFGKDNRDHGNISYTPYIGGVGLLTRSALLSNIVNSYVKYFNMK